MTCLAWASSQLWERSSVAVVLAGRNSRNRNWTMISESSMTTKTITLMTSVAVDDLPAMRLCSALR